MKTISNGDMVFIVLDSRKRWIRKAKSGEKFVCHVGGFLWDDVIGKKEFGSYIRSTPGNVVLYLFEPLPSDIVVHMQRASQIIYPEDIGLILVYSNLRPGAKVVEAGCGSGSLTSIMARFVAPHGHIYSFDIRDEAVKQARKNVASMGYSEIVSIELKDFKDLDFKEIDFVMLDMGAPWVMVKKAHEMLRNSGIICIFSPVVEQVIKNVAALKESGFADINTYELLKRTIQTKPNATRPESRMVGHTGYMTFARKAEWVEDITKSYPIEKDEDEDAEHSENDVDMSLFD
jgi:tRNA (adenine57-N1/adenine58-N1)-methyltransferase